MEKGRRGAAAERRRPLQGFRDRLAEARVRGVRPRRRNLRRGDAAARRLDIPSSARGDAAATTWIIPVAVAATPRPVFTECLGHGRGVVARRHPFRPVLAASSFPRWRSAYLVPQVPRRKNRRARRHAAAQGRRAQKVAAVRQGPLRPVAARRPLAGPVPALAVEGPVAQVAEVRQGPRRPVAALALAGPVPPRRPRQTRPEPAVAVAVAGQVAAGSAVGVSLLASAFTCSRPATRSRPPSPATFWQIESRASNCNAQSRKSRRGVCAIGPQVGPGSLVARRRS